MTRMRHIKSTSAVFRLFLLVMGGLIAITAFSKQGYAFSIPGIPGIPGIPITGIPTPGGGGSSACDPEFMDAIESRAWLEVQREIAQNKNIISKPDSVLEYTCFKDALDVLASTAAIPLFSDQHELVFHNGQMAISLQALVGNAVTSYLTANFNHSYIDGRGLVPQLYDNSPAISMTDPFYLCTEMGRVWDTSQCLDFQNETRDGFFTLDWYVTNDPRLPVDGCLPAGGTGAYLSSAYNGNIGAYTVNNGAANDITPYDKDAVQSFVSFIEPGSCSEPIPTGLIVHRENYTYERYCDHVCSNPGCYYQPDSGLPGPIGGGPPCTSGAPGTSGTCNGP